MNDTDPAFTDVRSRFMVGIAGASACGKSVLARSIHSRFNHAYVSHFDLDGYHRHSREERRALGEYPDELEANRLKDAVSALRSLRSGHVVEMPVYDHVSGQVDGLHVVKPNPLVIVEGLHAHYLNEIAGETLVDLAVYVSPEESLRRSWKTARDVEERNYDSPMSVEAEIDARAPHRIRCITPQEEGAACLVRMELDETGVLTTRTLVSDRFISQELVPKRGPGILDLLFSRQRVKLNGRNYQEFSTSGRDIRPCLQLVDDENLQSLLPNRSHEKNKALYYNSSASILFRIILLLCAKGGKS